MQSVFSFPQIAIQKKTPPTSNVILQHKIHLIVLCNNGQNTDEFSKNSYQLDKFCVWFCICYHGTVSPCYRGHFRNRRSRASIRIGMDLFQITNRRKIFLSEFFRKTAPNGMSLVLLGTYGTFFQRWLARRTNYMTFLALVDRWLRYFHAHRALKAKRTSGFKQTVVRTQNSPRVAILLRHLPPVQPLVRPALSTS